MTRTILITGATDGIGRLTARTLAAEGHTVLLHGRSADKLAAVADEIAATGSKSAQLALDFSAAQKTDYERYAQVSVLFGGVFWAAFRTAPPCALQLM